MKLNEKFSRLLSQLEIKHKVVSDNFISMLPETLADTQKQTADAFSDKWTQYDHTSKDFEKLVADQRRWYLSLFGFSSESDFSKYLKNCKTILDAGAGTCYKPAWFAELSPSSIVVAADISTSLYQASKHYQHLKNLFFIQCDIGHLPFFKNELFDYVSCDQVIHHTTNPYKTFQELVRITGKAKELSVYVYRKKALPRELVDDYFREFSKTLDHEKNLELSKQVTELGKVLSTVDKEIQFPDIPSLNIEGGKMTVQRFIYWNFLKCFWNEELGYHNSLMTNYDWYSPSQAFRYSEQEFKKWIDDMKLKTIHFHKEKACYSGRFSK